MPSSSSQDLINKGRHYYTPNYKPRDMILDHGRGSTLWDKDGNEYIDFGAGIAVASLGYHSAPLLKALHEQAEKLWHTSNIFFTQPPIELAEALVKASNFGKRVFFCNSGGEANEAAIKLARKWASDQGRPPEKRVILSFQGSFHGRTLATVTATAQPKYHHGFEPLPEGFDYLPFNDFDAVAARMAKGDVCAVLSEVVQGEGGITPMQPGFLKHLRELCDKHGALLMLDQVQCGMGRTGKLFSHFWEDGVQPDTVSLAKGLGGGIPIGALVVGEKGENVLQFGTHGTTFGGNPLATHVAHAVLTELQKPGLMQNVETRGEQLKAGLRKLNEQFKLFADVRGRGLMVGAELVPTHHGKAGDISELARMHGVIVLQAGPNVLRFVPPLVITEKEVEAGLSRLEKALKEYTTKG